MGNLDFQEFWKQHENGEVPCCHQKKEESFYENFNNIIEKELGLDNSNGKYNHLIIDFIDIYGWTEESINLLGKLIKEHNAIDSFNELIRREAKLVNKNASK